MSPTTVHVCRKCKGHEPLMASLDGTDGVHVEAVRCQSICKGAVAGMEIDDTMIWFRRLRGKKDRKKVAKLARRGGAGPIPGRLVDHIDRKRLGRPPKR